MRIYKVLACVLAVMCAILMATVSQQDQTVEQQQRLIRRMESNKSCMVATGGQNETNN